MLNSKFNIRSCPNGIIGVQQSLKSRIVQRLTVFIQRASKDGVTLPDTIKIKLTGDGTRIARGLNIVNIAFTIVEEKNKACSVFGNYTVAIMKISESYEQLASGLQDIIEEARDIQVLKINEQIFKIIFFLGGDWKFLATSCGLDAANSEFPCIWCKCPKLKRADLSLEWSITDPRKGARTTEEIKKKAKLGKRNKDRYNCSRDPLFDFIPMDRVIIDTLHLFLRISDNLIELLIRDIHIKDGITKTTKNIPSGSYSERYEKFLNENKIRFKWITDKDSKESVQHRDLTGPEKLRLFKSIDIPTLFPDLPKAKELGQLWRDFLPLITAINVDEVNNTTEIKHKIKKWMELYLSIYQTKDVTPYLHALAMHVVEFLSLHKTLVRFTQQGLEKLNDLSTKHFQRASNHKDIESLKQMLEKQNRIEQLEDEGYQRTKRSLTCSKCKQHGHNKRSCNAIH